MASILIIDDDGHVRAALRMALEDAGHAVREAAHGAAGLEAYRSDPADLVISDVYMPETDGLETLRVLRREWPDARVIAMSGGSARLPVDVLSLARALGAIGVLDKPVRAAGLLEMVGRALAPAP
jgi:two-component system, chemotaxis family, chemotaxis protein CheY